MSCTPAWCVSLVFEIRCENFERDKSFPDLTKSEEPGCRDGLRWRGHPEQLVSRGWISFQENNPIRCNPDHAKVGGHMLMHGKTLKVINKFRQNEKNLYNFMMFGYHFHRDV